MSSYQYRKSHCGNKTILRPSYLHNGISYTNKMTYFYWIGALNQNTNFYNTICVCSGNAKCVPRPHPFAHRSLRVKPSLRSDLKVMRSQEATQSSIGPETRVPLAPSGRKQWLLTTSVRHDHNRNLHIMPSLLKYLWPNGCFCQCYRGWNMGGKLFSLNVIFATQNGAS